MLTLSSLPPAQQSLWLGFALAFGLLWGSFLNVVIHRLPRGESVVRPRSRCPSCLKTILWYQNIPVLSWVALRGKCGHCSTRISWRYPVVELLTGAMFFLAARQENEILAWPFHFFFLAALIACTFIDIDHWILPDKITLPGILVGLAGSFFSSQVTPLGSLLGVLLGGGILYAVAAGYQFMTHKDGLGGGDIKFLAMIGAFLGPQGAITTLVLSSCVGSVLGIFLIALRGKNRSTAVQFGPFLALGAATAFFFGAPLWQWYFG